MKQAITTTLEVAGAALIAGGVALVSLPLGMITAGLLLIGISYLVVRR